MMDGYMPSMLLFSRALPAVAADVAAAPLADVAVALIQISPGSASSRIPCHMCGILFLGSAFFSRARAELQTPQRVSSAPRNATATYDAAVHKECAHAF